MGRLAAALILWVLCSSCSIYNYNVLKSNIQGEPEDPFAYDDDSVKLRYSFKYGEGKLDILNKSNRPLYIDWTRSSIIFDNESRSFTEISGVDNMTFIPPMSALNDVFFGLPTVEPSIIFGNASAEVQHYTMDTSPMKFRSYLVMSPTEDFYETVMIDHKFWIAESWQTNEQLAMGTRHDVMWYSTLTEDGEVVTALVGTAAAIGLVALCISHPTPEEP